MSVHEEPMEVDGGAVLKWQLENIAEKFRLARESDTFTSGLYRLKKKNDKQVRLFLQFRPKKEEGSDRSQLAIRRLDRGGPWPVWPELTLWTVRDNGSKSEEIEISGDWGYAIHRDFLSHKELVDFQPGEALVICIRFNPSVEVYSIPLQPFLFLTQERVYELPGEESFEWFHAVEVEQFGTLCIELDKPWDRPGDDMDEPSIFGKLILSKLPAGVEEVVFKYELWMVDQNSDDEPVDRQRRTAIDSEIVSFTATQKVAHFSFDASEYGVWENGTLNLAIRGYRLERKPPAVHLNDGPYGDLLERRFDDPNYANIRVLVDGRVFHVCKERLIEQSKYYFAMFKHPSKEQLTNVIEIKDFEAPIVDAMLRFMCTGRVDIGENARLLFLAAEKYEVELLQDVTIQHMCNQLTIENLVEMMSFSLEHLALEKLRKGTLNFAARHYPQLHDRGEWEEFAAEHPPFVQRLMEKVLSSK